MIDQPRRRGALTLVVAAVLGLAVSSVMAQAQDHPTDKPIHVGTDFGIAPFVIRTASQAVITRRAFAALNEIPTANYAATQNPQIKVGFAEYTGRNFGYALRLESVAFRNQVEEAIECTKLDGWLVKNYEKWFKQSAPKDPALTTVYPGYGPPGFKGHDPTPHTPKCK